jgi:hypothetical protein
MPINLSTLKDSARVFHTGDDAYLQDAYNAAVSELEERTGWCLDPVTRTQYVVEEPKGITKLVRLERQPATACTCVDTLSATVTLSLVTINGLHYANLTGVANLAYPLVLTVSAGNNTLHPLLKMAVLQRVTQLNAGRGDDTVPLKADFWDNVCAMMGKGIG